MGVSNYFNCTPPFLGKLVEDFGFWTLCLRQATPTATQCQGQGFANSASFGFWIEIQIPSTHHPKILNFRFYWRLALFPITYHLSPIPYPLFPIPYSLSPIPYSLFPIPYSLFPIPQLPQLPPQVRSIHVSNVYPPDKKPYMAPVMGHQRKILMYYHR
jgi:hypothetical protein